MSIEDDDNERRMLNREKRLRKHYVRVGFPNPKCLFCDEDNPISLQLDHIDGREFSDALWPVCFNDHAKRTDLQKDHPPKDADPKDPLEVHGRFDEGLADYLEMIVTRLRIFGPMLCAEAAARSPRQKQEGGGNDTKGGDN